MILAERYRLERPIARGGNAEIFAAIDLEEGDRRVAVKRALPRRGEACVASFRDEARIMRRLDHPNIVSLFDFGIEGGVPFQVLELVGGGDLERLANAAAHVPEEIALYLAREVARALDHAHRAVALDGSPLGIVHRDVTPENILVSSRGEVKLCDFAVAFAAVREGRTAHGIAKGKLEYLAPEQLRGEAVDPRTDVFALGCVLHRLIAGASPLADPTARRRVAEGTDPPLDRLPPDVEEIVARAVALTPEARYRSAEELALACDAALSRRLAGDPREALAGWIAAIDPTKESRRRRHAARDLVDLEYVLGRDPAEVAPTSLITRRVALPAGRRASTPPLALISGGSILLAISASLVLWQDGARAIESYSASWW